MESKIKILYVSSNSDLAGGPVHCVSLLNHFCTKYDVKGVFGGRGEVLERVNKKIPIFVIGELGSKINPLNDMIAFYKLRRLVNECNPDILHLHSFKAAVMGRILAPKQCLVVYTVHGWPWRGKNIFSAFISFLIEFFLARIRPETRYIFVDKKSMAHLIMSRIISNKQVILNGVPRPKNIFSMTSFKSEGPSFIFVSRVADGKRHDLISKSFLTYKREGGRGTLSFVGHGTDSERFKKMVSKHVKEKITHVRFFGPISIKEDIYKDHHVVVLLSDFEALPLSLIEGMSYGLPQLASNVGGVSEIVDGRTGILIDPGNSPFFIANQMLELDNEKTVRRFSDASIRKFDRKFFEGKMFSSVNDVYSKIERNEKTSVDFDE